MGLVLVLVSLFSVGVFGKTLIAGVVTEADGKTPVVGADVEINCSGVIKYDDTSDAGTYAVEYYISDCGIGDLVTATAVKEGSKGSNLGYVVDRDEFPGIDLHIAIINVSIPEFTTITAGIALAGAFLGLSIFRKKY